MPFDPTKDSLVVVEDTGSGAITTRSRRHSSSGRRRSSGGGSSAGDGTPRKKSSDTAADRPSLEGIFNDSEDGSSSDIFDVGAGTASPSPRRDSGGGRRRSSNSADVLNARRPSSGPQSGERSPRRKSAAGERRRSSSNRPRRDPSPRRGRRAGGASGPPSLSQTQHAARSLSAMGLSGSGSTKPRTRAEVKEQGRVREWASFCRRKTYLSLEDLSLEERPRVARKGAVTPFSLQLMRVKL